MSRVVPHQMEAGGGSACWWVADGLVWFRCPNGHIGTLTDHGIDDGGHVEPSVQCMSCGYHEEHLQLAKWVGR